jgi:hypothetical protein
MTGGWLISLSWSFHGDFYLVVHLYKIQKYMNMLLNIHTIYRMHKEINILGKEDGFYEVIRQFFYC